MEQDDSWRQTDNLQSRDKKPSDCSPTQQPLSPQDILSDQEQECQNLQLQILAVGQAEEEQNLAFERGDQDIELLSNKKQNQFPEAQGINSFKFMSQDTASEHHKDQFVPQPFEELIAPHSSQHKIIPQEQDFKKIFDVHSSGDRTTKTTHSRSRSRESQQRQKQIEQLEQKQREQELTRQKQKAKEERKQQQVREKQEQKQQKLEEKRQQQLEKKHQKELQKQHKLEEQQLKQQEKQLRLEKQQQIKEEQHLRKQQRKQQNTKQNEASPPLEYSELGGHDRILQNIPSLDPTGIQDLTTASVGVSRRSPRHKGSPSRTAGGFRGTPKKSAGGTRAKRRESPPLPHRAAAKAIPPPMGVKTSFNKNNR